MLENHMIQCKRAYESPAPDDGQRVLVDRLWPRNCRKEALKLDQWHKELAPSTELRRAFKSGEQTFEVFRERYRQELAAHPEYWWPLLGIAERERRARRAAEQCPGAGRMAGRTARPPGPAELTDVLRRRALVVKRLSAGD